MHSIHRMFLQFSAITGKWGDTRDAQTLAIPPFDPKRPNDPIYVYQNAILMSAVEGMAYIGASPSLTPGKGSKVFSYNTNSLLGGTASGSEQAVTIRGCAWLSSLMQEDMLRFATVTLSQGGLSEMTERIRREVEKEAQKRIVMAFFPKLDGDVGSCWGLSRKNPPKIYFTVDFNRNPMGREILFHKADLQIVPGGVSVDLRGTLKMDVHVDAKVKSQYRCFFKCCGVAKCRDTMRVPADLSVSFTLLWISEPRNAVVLSHEPVIVVSPRIGKLPRARDMCKKQGKYGFFGLVARIFYGIRRGKISAKVNAKIQNKVTALIRNVLDVFVDDLQSAVTVPQAFSPLENLIVLWEVADAQFSAGKDITLKIDSTVVAVKDTAGAADGQFDLLFYRPDVGTNMYPKVIRGYKDIGQASQRLPMSSLWPRLKSQATRWRLSSGLPTRWGGLKFKQTSPPLTLKSISAGKWQSLQSPLLPSTTFSAPSLRAGCLSLALILLRMTPSTPFLTLNSAPLLPTSPLS